MSNDCSKVRELLGAYADGELDPERVTFVRGHVAACAECRHELAAIEQLTTLVRKAGPPQPAEDYWDWQRQRVWRRLREDGRERQRSWRLSVWPRLATLAGALVVVLVVVFVGWQMVAPGSARSKRVVATEGRVPVLVTVPSVAAGEATDEAPSSARKAPPPAKESRAAEAVAPIVSAEKLERELDDLDSKRASTAMADRVSGAGPAPSEMARGGSITGATEGDQARAEERPASPRRTGSGAALRGWLDSVIVQNREVVRRKDRPGASSESGRLAAVSVKAGEIPEQVNRLQIPAVAEKDTGTVVVSLTTDTLGRVIKAMIARSGGSAELDSMAVRVARQARFRPVVDSGRRVQSDFKYPVRFRSAELDSRKDK